MIYQHTYPHLHTECSAVFDQNWHDPRAPPSRTFFVSQMKKVLKGKHFADVREVKQKLAEALKGCFGQWEKHLNRCSASDGEYLEGDLSLNM